MSLSAASEKKLKGVKPDLAAVARRASEIGPPFEIVQGNRTQAEQNAIYAQGRTKPGKIVTWTKNSRHIGGNAIDFAALAGGHISWNDKLYQPIANAFSQAANELGVGIERGIDWKTKDYGHIQLSQRAPTPTKPTSGIGWTMSDIQNALVANGFKPGTIDGILGPKTRAALKAFQKARGLAETGGTNKETLDALGGKKPPAAPPQSLASIPPVEGPEYGSPRWAIDYLIGQGLSEQAAIAMVANLMWESGGNQRGKINWDAHGDKGKDGEYHSHGAGQWNDRHGRWQSLQTFADQLGTEVTDPQTQLDFMLDELKGSERNVGKMLKDAGTLDEAMEAALAYWRPSIPHTDRRKAIAEKLEEKYHAG